jgi:hypothetical protein
VPRFVRADRRRLRQVLLTLVHGAIGLRVDAEQTAAAQAVVRFGIDGGDMLAPQSGVTRAGLRAAVAARLMESMGGRLEPAPDGVVLTIPLAVIASEPRDARRLLLVEIDASQRRLLSGLLEEAGFAVTARSSADTDEAFPVAVLGDGIDVAPYRAAWPAAHVVVVRELGAVVPPEADAVLWSPVDPEELLAAVSTKSSPRRGR